MKQLVIDCQSLVKVYDSGPQPVSVLNDVNLSLEAGERLAIIGCSGAGKSTLLNLLGGLDVPTSGQVSIMGKNLSDLNEDDRGQLRNRYLGFVYQFHHLLGEFTAEENVAMPLLICGMKKSEALNKSRAILQRVGLELRAQHKPSELSGGERQRVAIARAIVTEPACVLMDEPTGNLDEETASAIKALLTELNEQLSLSFIIVTHDKNMALSMDRVVELKAGHLQAYSGSNLDDSSGNANG